MGSSSKQVVARNRKAAHNYFVRSEVEAGISLSGPEVKSIRAGKVSLDGSYAHLNARGRPEVVGLYVAPYEQASVLNANPRRVRSLLLSKREIAQWKKHLQQRGMTMIPLELYFLGGWAKLKVGVCQGKKLHDKREVLKTREAERDMGRASKRSVGG